jgi:hypothetical protein
MSIAVSFRGIGGAAARKGKDLTWRSVGISVAAVAQELEMRAISTVLSVICLCGAAMAEPAPPQMSAVIRTMQVGVLCQPRALRTEPAPDTELGYITIAEGKPQIAFAQQVVPDAIGMSFGVSVIPTRSIAVVRMETYRPGQTDPDSFSGVFIAGEEQFHFFSFEFAREQLPGLWRMEAWDGDSLIYRVEFEVVPEGAMPDLVARCRATS